MFLLGHEKQHGRMNGWDSAKFVSSMEKNKQTKKKKKHLSSKQLLNITALMTRLGRTI